MVQITGFACICLLMPPIVSAFQLVCSLLIVQLNQSASSRQTIPVIFIVCLSKDVTSCHCSSTLCRFLKALKALYALHVNQLLHSPVLQSYFCHTSLESESYPSSHSSDDLESTSNMVFPVYWRTVISLLKEISTCHRAQEVV